VIERLPADFPGTVLVTIHRSPHSPGHLAEMLQTTTGIPVSYAADGQRLQAGRVLVAPPDRHLVVEDGIVRLSNGPRENRARPAIDPMFRSAAAAYREGVVAVLLSGLLDDGADGMIAVKRAGGCAFVQEPAEADYPDMPQAALRHAEVDEVLPAAAIGRRLIELSREDAEPVAADAAAGGDEYGRGGLETEGISGWDAFRKMHERDPAVRALMVSGYLDPPMRARMLEGGARGFLRKPYTLGEMLRAMREGLDDAAPERAVRGGNPRERSGKVTRVSRSGRRAGKG